MQAYRTLHRVNHVRTDFSYYRIAPIIRETRVDKIETTLIVLATAARCEENELVTLMMEAICSVETPVLTRTIRDIPENGFLHVCSAWVS
jgi:hypothetical protein